MFRILFALAALLGVRAALAQELGTQAFPVGFDWCAATAGHQIEGGNSNSDWWLWEQEAGHIAHGERSGLASNSWNLMDADLKVMEELHLTSYRFSVEWARIEPKHGQIDEAAVAHYAKLIQELNARGIKPIVTLQHFVMPQWFRSSGGWEWSGSTEAFKKFTRLVRDRIAPEAQYFVTVNEPMVNIMGGYYLGNVPPGEKRELKDTASVIVGMLKAHVAAYRALHENGADVKVGMAHHLRVFDAERWYNPLDRYIAGVLDNAWNWALPDAMETGVLKINIPGAVNVKITIEGLKGTHDFVGMNYYTREKVNSGMYLRSLMGKPTRADQDRLAKLYLPANWESYPKGMERLLLEIHRRYHGRPSMITENGIDDGADTRRPEYLRTHLQAVNSAIQRGAIVTGYCHWAMIDNFEWLHGFTPRFGLYSVDYSTYERRPRASGIQFSEYATQNAVW